MHSMRKIFDFRGVKIETCETKFRAPKPAVLRDFNNIFLRLRKFISSAAKTIGFCRYQKFINFWQFCNRETIKHTMCVWGTNQS